MYTIIPHEKHDWAIRHMADTYSTSFPCEKHDWVIRLVVDIYITPL